MRGILKTVRSKPNVMRDVLKVLRSKIKIVRSKMKIVRKCGKVENLGRNGGFLTTFFALNSYVKTSRKFLYCSQIEFCYLYKSRFYHLIHNSSKLIFEGVIIHSHILKTFCCPVHM